MTSPFNIKVSGNFIEDIFPTIEAAQDMADDIADGGQTAVIVDGKGEEVETFEPAQGENEFAFLAAVEDDPDMSDYHAPSFQLTDEENAW